MVNITGSKQVVLVNSHDELVGQMDIFEAHTHPAKLHRAISVWLFRKNKLGKTETLLQKRSQYKITGVGVWGNSVCANVAPGESYKDCAYRRLGEELRIDQQLIKLEPKYKFEYRAYVNEKYGENELDQVFIGNYEGRLDPNPYEVEAVKWVDFEKLKKKMRVMNCELGDKKMGKLGNLETAELKGIVEPMKVDVDELGKVRVLPWTVMMISSLNLNDYK